MAKALPSRFDPDLLSRDGTRYEAVLDISSFPRLCAILSASGTAPEQSVHASALFSRRKDHIVASGRLKVDFIMQCQRCLEPVTVPVDEPYELVFVASEAEAQSLPEVLDPVVLDDGGQISAVDLYEDELILHVPQIPRHADPADCGAVAAAVRAADEAATDAEAAKPRPFDVLKDLNLH